MAQKEFRRSNGARSLKNMESEEGEQRCFHTNQPSIETSFITANPAPRQAFDRELGLGFLKVRKLSPLVAVWFSNATCVPLTGKEAGPSA